MWGGGGGGLGKNMVGIGRKTMQGGVPEKEYASWGFQKKKKKEICKGGSAKKLKYVGSS